MDLVSAVTQKCISACPSPWYSHLLLRAPLKTFQMRVLKKEVKHVTLTPAATSVPPRELTHKCVCHSVPRALCSVGMMPDPWWHLLQLVPQSCRHSLSSWDLQQVLSPGLCLSPTEFSSQILSKEPQWSVTTGLPKPAKKRQGLGCPAQLMVKCHLVIQRTQHSDTESQNYSGLLPLPDFQILTPMSHITENTKVLMSPVPEISALKRKPWYSLTDTEPKWPSPIRREVH